MINIKATMLCFAIGLSYGSNLSAAETGPLLISEVPSNQVYTEERIAQVKGQSDAVLKRGGEDSLVNEYLLFKKISGMNSEQLSEHDINFLKQATIHKVTAYKQHPEGPIAVPIFDISSLAQHKLFMSEVHSKKPELVTLLQTQPILFAEISTNNSVNLQAAKSALQEATSLSMPTADLLVDSYKTHANPNSLQLLESIVDTNGSYKAAEALLSSPHKSHLKHQLLSRLGQYFSEHEREALLKEQILNRTELAPQALIEYGKLPQTVLDRSILYSYLADETLGSSSAFALSELIRESSDYSNIVDFLRQHGSSRYAVANCLLALKLANTRDSKAHLRDILEQDYIQFEDIKAEVNSWLN
ncbi:hypothetical protein [Kangiella koreensis]|uniref:PBS lyase HEAT domain protein repeat-containing protein n=1 Tax=Kangiella koreensis (strain DSM 16069 / JCM 12317 / KCTC 12182 / SW-125) TaxID=523791 RepID=C7RD47_KANKD|nr:hypothetical protein [Kangiella koreensis]ACV27189.1 hypothetical protein Kkor_1777 [Kangiella koreensis DSM 16069]